ncbi:MAG: hypothetical protein NTZ34_10095 [Chloroflexi bacterium]|nr:hypothetical protein [Chloroflexota bacterium]
MKEEKNRGGAPKGNQNARKHAFYSQILNESQKVQLKEAHEVEGIDEEIAILRVKFLTLMREHPDRIDLQTTAANSIARLVTTRHIIFKNDKKGLKEAITKVFDEIGAPLGVRPPTKQIM